MANLRLPSRYEDLDEEFRGRLRPNPDFLGLIQQALADMQVSGGIRFLPVFGPSGCGKSSTTRELGTHLQGCKVVELPREAIQNEETLLRVLSDAWGIRDKPRLLVAIVDQYEETVLNPEAAAVPTQFVERLSLLDRGALAGQLILFVWLTTSRQFQARLSQATTRNARLLVVPDFELPGPPRETWSDIVEETFEFHNADTPLADVGLLKEDVDELGDASATIGETIQKVGRELSAAVPGLHDLSQYQVMMLWPVTDGLRIQRIQAFTHPRDGYQLDWSAFYRDLNAEDRKGLPLSAFNRARLYFDVRLVPIAAADLMPLCRRLDEVDPVIGPSYFRRLELSHFYTLLRSAWSPDAYAPLRERESERATQAREWYANATAHPVELGRRIAYCLRALGVDAEHEVNVQSETATVRADIMVQRPEVQQSKVIVELKAFSPDNTMPSSIRDAIRTTLRRHAQFAGFLGRQ